MNKSASPAEGTGPEDSLLHSSLSGHGWTDSNGSYIVLAEDNVGDVYLAKLALRENGLNHPVHVLSDGEAAVSFIDRFEADSELQPAALILLDLHLPKRDGLEVLEHLRSRERSGRVPVIVLTSSDAPSDRRSAEGHERVYFFRKPSSLTDFMRLGSIARELIQSVEPPSPKS